MVNSTLTRGSEPVTAFRHEALLYDGDAAFDSLATEFVQAGLAVGEAVMVATSGAKISRLRDRLGGRAAGVRFADMAELGANPARIIPAWQEFIADHPHRRLRGLGEPVWAGRTEAELAECRRHEALLNLAFDKADAFWLLCPYDRTTLAPDVIAGACCTHPHVRADGLPASGHYEGAPSAATPFCDPLPDPIGVAESFAFDLSTLVSMRHLVASRADRAGLSIQRRQDLVLAANEIATNSVLHGGGGGVLRIWAEASDLVCEISDRGRIIEPLAGRCRPTTEQVGGRGLWLANQLCDLVQVRAMPDGGVVRLRMRCC